MARGKHAASAAKARAEQAEDTLAALKAKFEAERAAWTRERADLRNEVQRLTNRLAGEVSQLAKEAIAAAATEARRSIEEQRDASRQRLVQALQRYWAGIESSRDLNELWAELLAAVDIQAQEAEVNDPEGASSRYSRRLSPARYLKTSRKAAHADGRSGDGIAKERELAKKYMPPSGW